MAYDYSRRLAAFKADVDQRVGVLQNGSRKSANDIRQAGVILDRVRRTAAAFNYKLLEDAQNGAMRAVHRRLLAGATLEIAISLANEGFKDIVSDALKDISVGEEVEDIEIAEFRAQGSPRYFGLTAAEAAITFTRGGARVELTIGLTYWTRVQATGGGFILSGKPVGTIEASGGDDGGEIARILRGELYKQVDKLSWTRPLPVFSFAGMSLPRRHYLTFADTSLHILGGCRDDRIATPRLLAIASNPPNHIGLRFGFPILTPVIEQYGVAFGARLEKISASEGGRKLALRFKGKYCKKKRISELRVKGCAYAIAKTGINLSHGARTISFAGDGRVALELGLESLSARIGPVSYDVPDVFLRFLEGIASRLGYDLRRNIQRAPFHRSIACSGFTVIDVRTWTNAVYFIIERKLTEASPPQCH